MSRSPDATDKQVGNRVRMRRLMLGLSQADVGKALRISFQQVQKYENGTNRISAGRLQQMAGVLDVPVPFFFEGLPAKARESKAKIHTSTLTYVTEFLTSSDGLVLAKAFMAIKSRKIRSAVVHMVETLADS